MKKTSKLDFFGGTITVIELAQLIDRPFEFVINRLRHPKKWNAEKIYKEYKGEKIDEHSVIYDRSRCN